MYQWPLAPVQVFSAICVIFAHGAGEVGYMAGPMAAIWDVYQKGVLEDTVRAEVWIILIAATGLVIGLATYGYNVTRAMGVKLAKITPTRGFSAELATAFVIMIASQYVIHISSPLLLYDFSTCDDTQVAPPPIPKNEAHRF